MGPDAVRGLVFAFLPYLVGGGLLAPLLTHSQTPRTSRPRRYWPKPCVRRASA